MKILEKHIYTMTYYMIKERKKILGQANIIHHELSRNLHKLLLPLLINSISLGILTRFPSWKNVRGDCVSRDIWHEILEDISPTLGLSRGNKWNTDGLEPEIKKENGHSVEAWTSRDSFTRTRPTFSIVESIDYCCSDPDPR